MTGRWSWTIFLTCFVVALAGVGWISWTAVELERESNKKANHEENIRLALWRMESLLTPLMASEAARPPFQYRAYFPPRPSYSNILAPYDIESNSVPSPLIASPSPFIRLHFQVGPDEVLSSPQVPQHFEGAFAFNPGGTSYASLKELRAELAVTRLRSRLPDPRADSAPPEFKPVTPPVQKGIVQQTEQQALRQSFRNDRETQARARRAQSLSYGASGEPQQFAALDDRPETKIAFGVMKPVWLDDRLLLARRFIVDGRECIQGAWLDWAPIEAALVSEIADLLPEAQLEAVESPSPDEYDPRRLAVIPVRLLPGRVNAEELSGLTPTRISLLVAGLCVVIAGGAIALLLGGALSLSERRRDFVSAVTHELRTPLTTFRMYTEMLSEGMITDEKKKRGYLRKLTQEADRLSHLVENVLTYARLEANTRQARSRGMRIEANAASELVLAQADRLKDHVEERGLSFEVMIEEPAGDASVRVPSGALEQILFNLVDNASKYGRPVRPAEADSGTTPEPHQKTESGGRVRSTESPPHDPTLPSPADVLLRVSVKGGQLRLDVIDHGAGVPEHERARLFLPFTKSDSQAAQSAPGVGLGLALCRRLARSMHGELSVISTPGGCGACFRLALPLRKSRRPL